MAYEMKEGQISVFKNTGKVKDEQPDFDCSVKENGVVHKYGLWWRESKKGDKYLGGKKSTYAENSQQPPQPAGDDWQF
jgi:hypothetical protein